MSDTRLVFLEIEAHLEKYANDNSFLQRTMADAISRKIKEYWLIMDSDSIVFAILDPRSKLSVFSDESKPSAREHIQSVYELYKGKSLPPTNSAPSTPVTKRSRQYFTLLRNNAVPTDENEILTLELETEKKQS